MNYVDEITTHIKLLIPHCHWTEEDGDWENMDGFGVNFLWNGFKNTTKGKKLLTGYIIRKYFKEYQNAKS